jgi:hypothetical protein
MNPAIASALALILVLASASASALPAPALEGESELEKVEGLLRSVKALTGGGGGDSNEEEQRHSKRDISAKKNENDRQKLLPSHGKQFGFEFRLRFPKCGK